MRPKTTDIRRHRLRRISPRRSRLLMAISTVVRSVNVYVEEQDVLRAERRVLLERLRGKLLEETRLR